MMSASSCTSELSTVSPLCGRTAASSGTIWAARRRSPSISPASLMLSAVAATSCSQPGHTAPATISIDLIVRADDDPHDLTVPRGKQDWEAEPHEIFYPRTTGIWQRVWLERLPACHVADLAWRTEATTAFLDVVVNGPTPPGSWLEISLHRWPADVDEPSETALTRERVALRPGQRGPDHPPGFRAGNGQPRGDRPPALVAPPAQPACVGQWNRRSRSGAVIDATAGYTGLRTVSRP